jgi:hypothetical protein
MNDVIDQCDYCCELRLVLSDLQFYDVLSQGDAQYDFQCDEIYQVNLNDY